MIVISEQNVEIVLGFYEALSRGDMEAAERHLDEAVEWDTRVRGADGGLVYGPKGVITVIREWLDVWEDVTFDVRDVQEVGDQIAAHLRQRARGKRSGIEGEVDAFASFRVWDGKIIGYREYSSWSDTLSSVELSG